MTGNLLIKIARLISRMSSRHRCESNSHKANNDKQWWKWHENGVHFEPSLSQHAKGNSACGFHRNDIIRLSSDQAVKEPFGSAPKTLRVLWVYQKNNCGCSGNETLGQISVLALILLDTSALFSELCEIKTWSLLVLLLNWALLWRLVKFDKWNLWAPLLPLCDHKPIKAG